VSTSYSKAEVQEILSALAIGRKGLLNLNRSYLNRYKKTRIDLSQKATVTKEELRLAFGLCDLKVRSLDTADGWLSSYAWHKIESENGAGFSPVLFLISKARSLIPSETARLHTIERRIAQLETLVEELGYWRERYDWDELSLVYDVYLDKFETYCTRAVELAQLMAQLYYDVSSSANKQKRPQRFINFIDAMAPLGDESPIEFQSINFSLYMSAAIQVRNMVTHNLELGVEREGQDAILEIVIRRESRLGIFNDYLKEIFSLYEGPKKSSGRLRLIDPRFREFLFDLRVSKNARLDTDASKVRFKATVNAFVKILEGELFRVSLVLFRRIVRERRA